jgi:hypothetical protein
MGTLMVVEQRKVRMKRNSDRRQRGRGRAGGAGA